MNASKNTKPQYDLAAGVLSQARRDLRRFRGANQAAKRELYVDAYDWVVSESCSWPYSFRNVCEMLNLSPEYVRQEIFQDISSGAFNYWRRRFGIALRESHISLRQIVKGERSRDGAETVTLVHGLS